MTQNCLTVKYENTINHRLTDKHIRARSATCKSETGRDYFSGMFFYADKIITISFGNFFSVIGIIMIKGYFNAPVLLRYT